MAAAHRRIGFPIPRKENERRRALLPEQLSRLARPERMCFEPGYFEPLGAGDDVIANAGAALLPREELLALEVVCEPKPDRPEEYDGCAEGTILFGWVHAIQNRPITDALVSSRMTAIAWEEMYADGRHVFWRNNELAGEAAVVHACLVAGRSPRGMTAAVLGCGHAARGAMRALSGLGASVDVYDWPEIASFRKGLGRYDTVVNCVKWDVFNTERILYRADLARLKPGALIIDVSCNRNMEIETCRPTTIERPTYVEAGVTHYCVDHTPALLHRDATGAIGEAVVEYLDILAAGGEGNSATLRDATIIRDGEILDERVCRFQRR